MASPSVVKKTIKASATTVPAKIAPQDTRLTAVAPVDIVVVLMFWPSTFCAPSARTLGPHRTFIGKSFLPGNLRTNRSFMGWFHRPWAFGDLARNLSRPGPLSRNPEEGQVQIMRTGKQRDDTSSHPLRTTALVLTCGLVLAAVAASLLPLVETNVWWVRYFDFPRVQISAALLVLVALIILFGGLKRPWAVSALVLGLPALGYQAYRLHPYTRLVAPMALAAPDCAEGARLDVLVANVQQSNEQFEALFRMVDETDPDVFVVLETDARWDAALAGMSDRFPFSAQHVPEGEDTGAFGMHLFSRHRLVASETMFYYGNDTPTILADIASPGGAVVQIVAVHPRPPLYWSQPTTMRDAHLLTAALEARDSDIPTIVAGDLNAVPWERTVRRAMRIGELLDPRVGRGLYPTYDVENWLMSWPLDQILFQDGITLAAWEILPPFGSDHAPVLAGLCLVPDQSGRQSAPPLAAGDIEEAETSIEAARAMARASGQD
jgi:endonuclease/exonuclease/phosphatase (EEP) superfamily protein YafD